MLAAQEEYATISINDFLRNKQNGGKAEFKRK
jgi:hypothetical protein